MCGTRRAGRAAGTQNEQLTVANERLTARVAELERRLDRNSKNSTSRPHRTCSACRRTRQRPSRGRWAGGASPRGRRARDWRWSRSRMKFPQGRVLAFSQVTQGVLTGHQRGATELVGTGSRSRQLVPRGAPLPVHCVSPSALTAITRTVTVAAGRFAPGHLGELTPTMPFELVDAVLSETGTVQRRLVICPRGSASTSSWRCACFPRSATGWSGTS